MRVLQGEEVLASKNVAINDFIIKNPIRRGRRVTFHMLLSSGQPWNLTLQGGARLFH